MSLILKLVCQRYDFRPLFPPWPYAELRYMTVANNAGVCGLDLHARIQPYLHVSHSIPCLCRSALITRATRLMHKTTQLWRKLIFRHRHVTELMAGNTSMDFTCHLVNAF